MLRTGVVLPTFRDTPDAAFEAAAEAVAAGVDGLFCYDHIWPIGQPERPALAPFPILGALAARFASGEPPGGGGPFLGTLVARVGLVPNAVLAAQFTALEHLAPGRVIAGLGTGDRLSEEENRAYGIPFEPAAAAPRRAGRAGPRARRRRHRGLGRRRPGRAHGRGARGRCALNRVGRRPRAVAERGAGGELEVTWAGPPPAASPPLADRWPRCAGRARPGPCSAGRST